MDSTEIATDPERAEMRMLMVDSNSARRGFDRAEKALKLARKHAARLTSYKGAAGGWIYRIDKDPWKPVCQGWSTFWRTRDQTVREKLHKMATTGRNDEAARVLNNLERASVARSEAEGRCHAAWQAIVEARGE